MEVIIAIPLLLVPFIMPFITGMMAKTYGRKFWLWFWLGLLLPFIACAILLCLPDKSAKKNEISVQFEEFDKFYFDDEEQQKIAYGNRVSTSAQ